MGLLTPTQSVIRDRYPDSVILASEIIVVLALFMFVVEIVLEVLWVLETIPTISFRLEFLFLTGLSALLAVHSVLGIRNHKLDVTSTSLQISALVELALIISDIEPLFELEGHERLKFFYYRVGFIVLTGINLCCIIWITARLHLATVFLVFCTVEATQEEWDKTVQSVQSRGVRWDGYGSTESDEESSIRPPIRRRDSESFRGRRMNSPETTSSSSSSEWSVATSSSRGQSSS